MGLPTISKKLIWLPVLGLLILGGAALRTFATGGGGSAAATTNNLRQPIANTNGLVAWYPLDGDTKDYSGNHYDGTATSFTFDGTTNGWVNGKFGKALLFNGTSNWVNFGLIPTPSTAITLTVWINPVSPQDSTYEQGYIFGGTTETNDIELQCSLGPCYAYGSTQTNGSGLNRLSGVTPIPDGKFHLITLTYDSSLASNQQKIYLDGKFEAQTTATGTLRSWPRLDLGTYGAPSVYFHGSIDDARIYNRALSASEITQLYAGSPSQTCDQYCKIWLKFDDNAGTTAKDSVYGGVSGTLNGTTTWTSGNFASAVGLDGSTGSVSVPDLGMTAGTVDLWINPASVSGDQRLFTQTSGASTQAGECLT